MTVLVELSVDKIAELCAQNGVRTLRLFGSATTESFDPLSSDIDFLVTFSVVPDLATAYFNLKEGLQEVLGRPVDLVFEDTIKNPYFAQTALSQARDIYVA